MVNTDQIKDIQSRIEDLHKFLGIEKKKIEIANDDEKTAAPEFWEKPKEAEVFLKQLRSKKNGWKVMRKSKRNSRICRF